MAIRWNEYQRIREYENFDIFQRRGEGFPQFAFRGNRSDNRGEEGTADSPKDVNILIDEYWSKHIGLGPVSGYRRVKQPPPEEIYRDVVIGKFLFREEAVHLKKFMAIVRPDIGKKDKAKLRLGFFDRQVMLEGDSVSELRGLIDEVIDQLPAKYRKLFPDK